MRKPKSEPARMKVRLSTRIKIVDVPVPKTKMVRLVITDHFPLGGSSVWDDTPVAVDVHKAALARLRKLMPRERGGK